MALIFLDYLNNLVDTGKIRFTMQVAHEKVVYVIEVTKIILNLFIFFLQKYFNRIKTLANKKQLIKQK